MSRPVCLFRRHTTKMPCRKPDDPVEAYENDRKAFPFAKFWKLVDRSGGPTSCWRWMGIMHAKYGQFSPRLCGTFKANKIALIIKLKRDLLPGMETLHSCDHGWCCNPDHLSEGTHAQNMRDAVDRGLIRAGHRFRMNLPKEW